MHSFEKAENNKNNNDRIYDAGMLSDRDIRTFWKKGIEVEVADVQNYSFDIEKQLQHGSIDLRFRHDYKKISIPRNQVLTFEKMKNHEYTTSGEVRKNNKLILEPGEMILTTTMETVRLSENFAGIITGRSSIARLGIMVHCCQEFINPGHGQTIPLQIINLAPCSVELDLEVPICQLIIFKMRTPSAATLAERRKKVRKKNLKKYIEPFLPSVIMLTLVTPLFSGWITNKSLEELFVALKGIPAAAPLIVVFLGLFIWLKKED